MQIRDRIKELRRVPAGQLRANPRNWRVHPDGSLELIDGHLRAETTPDALVPVLVLDVDQAEALKLLATYDPLSALAETNQAALEGVLSDVETDSEALRQLLAGLADP